MCASPFLSLGCSVVRTFQCVWHHHPLSSLPFSPLLRFFLAGLVAESPALRELHLSHNDGITPDGLVAVAAAAGETPRSVAEGQRGSHLYINLKVHRWAAVRGLGIGYSWNLLLFSVSLRHFITAANINPQSLKPLPPRATSGPSRPPLKSQPFRRFWTRQRS